MRRICFGRFFDKERNYSMKKRIISLIASLVLIVSLLPLSAFAATPTPIKVVADKSEAKAGDTITYTITIGAVEKMQGFEFKVQFPDALTYVSYAVPDGLKETLGSDKADWTESSKKFIVAGGGSYSNAGETEIIKITCTVNEGASGEVSINITGIDMSDPDYETIETTLDLSAAKVTIKGVHTHVFDQKNTDVKYLASAASCTAKATYYYSCKCGEKGTATFESGETLPHTASTVWSKDETNHWHVCTVCNVEMDKAAHTPDHEGGATETYPIKCTECGYVIEAQLDHTHSFTQEVAEAKYLKSAAGCDAPAVYYKSCTCGEASTTETFQYGTALGHSYTAEKVAPQYEETPAGCETDAVYFKSCARCGAKGTETFTVANSALGHKGGAWQSDENGHWKLCERVNCGKRFSEAPHNGGTATCQEQAKCEICGAAYGKRGEHNFDTKWTSDDTYHYHKCLTAGCTEKADDAAKHSSTGANEANCLHKAKCDVCAAEYGNLGAHTLTKTAAKAPTCLEPGNNEYYTCSVCGKVFKDAAGTTETTVAAETLAKSTTHSVVKGEYATSATEHWQICKVCGTVVGKAAHKFGEADANGRKTCADCGYTVGGTGTEGHKHAAGNTICYDENNHWNKCTDANCDAHVNETKHTFTTVSTTKEGNTTITVEQCQCGYVKRTETTSGGTTPVNPGGNKPTKPGTKDNGKTVQSGKTFDAGVGVYVGLSILSLTGSAVVIGKKRKTR